MDNIKIHHNSQDEFYRFPFGSLPIGETVRLRISVANIMEVEWVKLVYWIEGLEKRTCSLSLHSIDHESSRYEVEIKLPSKSSLVWYYFKIHCKNQTIFYGNNQQALGGLGDIYDEKPLPYQITVFDYKGKLPIWFMDSIMYQIFPDRFYRDSQMPSPFKKHCYIYKNWQDTPSYIRDESGRISKWDFFGGNLAGITNKLDYLEDLGINLLYLNPIFLSPSNHRYDTSDYEKIDDLLGDEGIFLKLCIEAKKRGINIILDGVFSHTGSDSIYFNKDDNFDSLGAYQSKESPYFNWYFFEEYPDKYDCWWGYDNMPNVNEQEESYQNYIIHHSDSVINKWHRMGIKGWRLDVVDELPTPFVKAFKKGLRQIDEDAILIYH
ncbi:alpha-amylase family glycosyl hydrolase [Alkaliphilus serpentinus]|uniref:Glycosyl hydrolase family 13 catalytic domain-containing protein n=1 Tax=Alkaliphilus serpentinus TaxID=1482731 RepID=A0A833MEW6_9FIRM|nr:alpha-amylase family glycosyl hydrolase [Alkaliphilus serpentinus]KAB3532115.1 hypothetical protein F8153_03335 [Alkaliphilus serpentinus]